jgi:hypothetical protein
MANSFLIKAPRQFSVVKVLFLTNGAGTTG